MSGREEASPWALELELDGQLRIVAVDPRLCARLGCTPEDLTGEALDDLISARDRKGQRGLYEAMSRADEGGLDLLITLEVGGREVLTRLRMIPQATGGGPPGWRAQVEPLTADDNLVYRLYSAQERWSSVVKRSTEGVVVVDAQGRIVDSNASFFELMQFRSAHGVILSEEALRGRALQPLLRAQGSGLTALAEHLASPAAAHERFAAALVWGERWLEVTATALHLPVRGFVGVCVTIRDVTERREAEGLLRQKEAAEAANVAKSRFLANMSHELRTPLNAIIGYSDMLLEQAEEQEDRQQMDDLRKIGVAGMHLLDLISNILDLSKIEAGRMELWPERFSARSLVHAVSSALESLARRRGNRIELRIAGEVGFMVTDMLKLRQVLFNLLGNAIKFTEKGTIEVSARRSTIEGRDWMEITVADTGIGIDAEALPRLFRGFTQADASTTRRYGGAGLGLSIAREFCALMGGEIAAQSVKGGGSVFTVRVPTELRPAAPALAPALAQRTVLVIDDDPATHEQVHRGLQREGVAVVSCSSAAQGLGVARHLRPQAVVLGVTLGEHEGWTTLAQLRAEVALRGVPVIVASLLDEQARARGLGAAGYLDKPIEGPALLRALALAEADSGGHGAGMGRA